ncbi:MAG: phosphatase PAP2 family protein [Leptospiraceae bacterium]|nr:phosphatase PAP2 family protein [Leptospiraceae bacterium]MCP5493307.1 phosphatase PAP2 family protein [Leptospiraceae bacterium]
MDAYSVFSDNYLFGNGLLEKIPHPEGFLGGVFNILSFICHFMGGATFFAIFLPFLYLCFDRTLALKIGIGLLFSGFANGITKYFCENPRPSDLPLKIMKLQSHANETAFGFPSGHSHVSILVWGIFFLRFKNLYIRLVSVFFILFTPFSRMYIGVHYLGDVIGGFIMGLFTLVLLEFLFRKSPDFPDLSKIKENFRKKAIRSISLLIVALTIGVLFLQKKFMTEAHISSFSQAVSSSGSLGGFLVGILVLKYGFKHNYFDWSTVENVKEFAIRSLVLIPGILIFYFAMGYIGKILLSEQGDYTYLYRYSRYFLLNLYIVLLAPLIFKKLKKLTL